jgi:tRNA pseudouridine55 synthase
MSEDKQYVGTVMLGSTTSTQDAEGDTLQEWEVPEFSEEKVRAAFDKFTGAFEQIPPMVSAIKKDGVPLYKLARKGQEVERDPRPVHVTSYELSRIAIPEVDFTVHCSKGFYVRTYAHDIGAELECGGHLSALRRTRSGKFNLERSVKIDTLKTAESQELIDSMVSLAEISLMRGA